MTKPITYTVTLHDGNIITFNSLRFYQFAVIGFNKNFNCYSLFSTHAEMKHAEVSVRNQISWGETEVKIVSLSVTLSL